jgi:hypothetical protein
MEAFANTATEAAKFIGVLLWHSGKLRAFGSGTESVVIAVKNEELHVQFLAWYCIRDGKYEIKLQSKYVRRVSSAIFTVKILKIHRMEIVFVLTFIGNRMDF